MSSTVSSRRPLRLAYFSPLAPRRSGISDYSADLLPSLASWAEVHLFVDGYAPDDPQVRWRFPVWSHRDYPWLRQVHRYDCTIYQMGNSLAHAYMLPYVSRFPGVLVLHDLVLHHLIAGMAMDRRDPGLYFRHVAYSHGLDALPEARDVLIGLTQAPFFRRPLSRLPIEASLGVLVHSAYAQQQVQAMAPGVPVARVPMGIPLPDEIVALDLSLRAPGGGGDTSDPPAALRARLGLPAGRFLVGSFGEATGHKRIPAVLRAVARLVASGVDAHYVVVGNADPQLRIEELVALLGLAGRVTITGYEPQERFNAYLHAVDVCINLRYPTAGETSASALRCMAAGRATIVSDVGANRELPDTACFKLPVDGAEEPLLAAVLERLASHPDERERLARQGREYVAREHRLPDAARGYVRFIEEVLAAAPQQVEPQPPGLPPEAGADLEPVARALADLGVRSTDYGLLYEVSRALEEVGAGGAGAP